jgi:hypothetical protein
MSVLITRDDLGTVLKDWESGERTASQVHAWAEERYAVHAWECEDDVTNEVLAALDMLDVNLLTRDDVPVLRAMLELPAGSAAHAAEVFDTHFEQVDLDERKRNLARERLYAPFCEK